MGGLGLLAAVTGVLALVGAVALGVFLGWRATKESRELIQRSKQGERISAETRRGVTRSQIRQSLVAEVICLPILLVATVVAHLSVLYTVAFVVAIGWTTVMLALASRAR